MIAVFEIISAKSTPRYVCNNLRASRLTLKDCLPESKQNRDRWSFSRDEGIRRPNPDFDAASVREELRHMETKRRKINNAIQAANFNHCIELDGDSITISEALEMRRDLTE